MSQYFRVLSAAFIGCLVIASVAAAQETPEGYCAVGTTASVKGRINLIRQKPDKTAWAFTFVNQDSTPCKADGVILENAVKPANCEAGRVISASGKVRLFNPNNPKSQIISAVSVSCS